MELLISLLVGAYIGWTAHPDAPVPPVLQTYREEDAAFDWRWRDEGEEVCLTKENFGANVARSIRVKAAYEKCAAQAEIYNQEVSGGGF